MTTHYGKGIAQRTCAAADRTGHAMLHTMYGQSLAHERLEGAIADLLDVDAALAFSSGFAAVVLILLNRIYRDLPRKDWTQESLVMRPDPAA
jgi:succinate dehydrogenase/fumarate reductase flavoprotein subunit